LKESIDIGIESKFVTTSFDMHCRPLRTRDRNIHGARYIEC
jgi:hypothetical protein